MNEDEQTPASPLREPATTLLAMAAREVAELRLYRLLKDLVMGAHPFVTRDADQAARFRRYSEIGRTHAAIASPRPLTRGAILKASLPPMKGSKLGPMRSAAWPRQLAINGWR